MLGGSFKLYDAQPQCNISLPPYTYQLTASVSAASVPNVTFGGYPVNGSVSLTQQKTSTTNFTNGVITTYLW